MKGGFPGCAMVNEFNTWADKNFKFGNDKNATIKLDNPKPFFKF